MLFDKVIAFDHWKQKIIFIVNITLDNWKENYNKAVIQLHQMIDLLHHGEAVQESGIRKK